MNGLVTGRKVKNSQNAKLPYEMTIELTFQEICIYLTDNLMNGLVTGHKVGILKRFKSQLLLFNVPQIIKNQS